MEGACACVQWCWHMISLLHCSDRTSCRQYHDGNDALTCSGGCVSLQMMMFAAAAMAQSIFSARATHARVFAAATQAAATASPPLPPIPWDVGWPAPLPVAGREGNWMSHGNHRFELVSATAGRSVADVRWQRSDADALQKATMLLDEHGRHVSCTRLSGASQDSARFLFNASHAGAVYHLYYMPFTSCEYDHGACPYNAQSTYLTNATKEACHSETESPCASIDTSHDSAAVVGTVYQARNSFQSFDPMGLALGNIAALCCWRHIGIVWHIGIVCDFLCACVCVLAGT